MTPLSPDSSLLPFDHPSVCRECRELHPGMASVDDWLEQRGVAEFEVEPTVFDRLLKQLRERLMQEPLQK